MKISMMTTDDLARVDIPAEKLVNLEIQIGHTVYQLSERDGQLRLSVEGSLVARPGGANMMTFSREI